MSAKTNDFVLGSSTDYTNWADHEPNENQGLEKCVEGQVYGTTSG